MSALLELNLKPGRATLRSFGLVALGGFGALALCAWQGRLMFSGLGESRNAVALVLAALGTCSALFSLVVPQANRPLYVTLSLLSYPLGLVVSHVIVATLYFGLIAPIAIVFRWLGRDPLQRHIDPAARSHWTACRKARSKEDYFRQY